MMGFVLKEGRWDSRGAHSGTEIWSQKSIRVITATLFCETLLLRGRNVVIHLMILRLSDKREQGWVLMSFSLSRPALRLGRCAS
jgi:hypothetical protein